MESFSWKLVSVGIGALAAIAARKALGVVWPGAHTPPLNPADRSVNWGEAVAWAVSSGIGAGLGRLVSKRLAAGGWEKATGNPPPGLTPS